MFGIVVNPVSGGGKYAELAKQIGRLIEEKGERFRIFETTCEGDGACKAQLAVEYGCDSVVCIGGDGTLSEVVQALANSEKTLYFVPGGTGNDFVRALGLPKDPVQAFCAQLDGEETKIDCGRINRKAFMNIAGSGFDVEVLRKTEELKSVYPGEKAYSKAVLAVLGSYQAFEADISIDSGAYHRRRLTIVEIANGRFFGGGMCVAPGADYRDGLFDVVFVDSVHRLLIPFLLPLFKLGLHVYFPIVKIVHAKKVSLRAPGMVVNIDGRLEQMDEALFEVMPHALNVRLPKKE